jgi:DNA-damage-inducible protein J
MANTNITVRMDESLKKDLQNLMSNLGMDITTFFTLAAKQAVREQALPFQPKMINTRYDNKAYQLAMKNTTYNSEGKAVITKDDEWREETEWDDIYAQMKAEKGL